MNQNIKMLFKTETQMQNRNPSSKQSSIISTGLSLTVQQTANRELYINSYTKLDIFTARVRLKISRAEIIFDNEDYPL